MKPKPEDVSYWQGLMDGMYMVKGDVDVVVSNLRESISKGRHVCYSAMLGPYCAICRRDLPPPYEPIWSDDEAIR